MERDASCHCGKLILRCRGEPAKVSLCHCMDCQRRTGSLFSVAAFFPRSDVALVAGAAECFRRPSASGFDVAFHFCPACGSSLRSEEHTSELQSLMRISYAVFCLKKKTNSKSNSTHN